MGERRKKMIKEKERRSDASARREPSVKPSRRIRKFLNTYYTTLPA